MVFGLGSALVTAGLAFPRTRVARLRRGPVSRLISRAGLDWPREAVVGLGAASALAGATVTALVTRLPVAACLAGVAAAPLPVWALVRVAEARRRRLIDAWPDAIDALLAAVRSGDSLTAALATVASGGPEPLRPGFAAASLWARSTGDFAGAVHGLADGLGDGVSRQVGSALVLAHQVGGRELGHVLRDLGGFLREERALRREVEARQSWAVTAARVAAAGPWAVLALLAARPETRAAFAGVGGGLLLVIGAVSTILGYRLMVVLGRLPRLGGIA